MILHVFRFTASRLEIHPAVTTESRGPHCRLLLAEIPVRKLAETRTPYDDLIAVHNIVERKKQQQERKYNRRYPAIFTQNSQRRKKLSNWSASVILGSARLNVSEIGRASCRERV